VGSNSSATNKDLLSWAEFISARYRDYYGLLRKEPQEIPCYFGEADIKRIKNYWKKTIGLMENNFIPRQIGLDVHFPAGLQQINECAVLTGLVDEINIFSNLFQKIPFSMLSIVGGYLCNLKDDLLDKFFSEVAGKFHWVSESPLSIQCFPESLTDSKLAILSRYGLKHISLQSHLSGLCSPNNVFKFNQISKILSGISEVVVDVEFYIESIADFQTVIKQILQFRPRNLYLHNLIPDPRILPKLMDQTAHMHGYRIQCDDGEYLADHPWEKAQMRGKAKARASVLGIGWGSLSHAFGSAWYQHPLKSRLNFEDIPPFFAVDFNIEDEMRGFVTGSLTQTGKVSRAQFQGLFHRDILMVPALEKSIDELRRLGFVEITEQLILWVAAGSVERAAQLKRFYSPQIISSILREDALAFKEFIGKRLMENGGEKSLISGAQNCQNTLAYYDSVFWNARAFPQ
jgi:hypothetical protein